MIDAAIGTFVATYVDNFCHILARHPLCNLRSDGGYTARCSQVGVTESHPSDVWKPRHTRWYEGSTQDQRGDGAARDCLRDRQTDRQEPTEEWHGRLSHVSTGGGGSGWKKTRPLSAGADER